MEMDIQLVISELAIDLRQRGLTCDAILSLMVCATVEAVQALAEEPHDEL